MKKLLQIIAVNFVLLFLSYSTYSQIQIIDVQHVGHPITIDGDFWEWDSATVHQIDKVSLSGDLLPPMGNTDYNPTFSAAWDDDNLYFFFNIEDDSIKSPDSLGVDVWNRDGIELAIDGNYNRDFNMFWSSAEDASDMKIMITADVTHDKIVYPPLDYGNNLQYHSFIGFEIEVVVRDNGWGAELAIPWPTVWSTYSSAPDSVLIGIAANDCDTIGVRKTILRWSSDPTLSINTDASEFGRLVFVTDSVPEPAPKPEPASVEDNKVSELNVWPNPATSQLNISSGRIIKSVNIINILGQNTNITNINESKNINLNVSSLQKGIYILSIKDEEGYLSTRKFYKQ